MTTLSSLLLSARARLTWVTKTANYTAANREGVMCDTATTAAFTVTLPASPRVGDTVAVMDSANKFTAANLTIGRNSLLINGAASNLVLASSGSSMLLTYSGTTKGWVTSVFHTGSYKRLPRGYINGLEMSNGTDAVNDIDIAVGECRDSTNSTDMLSTAIISKRSDAAWASGTGNGGMDTGARANSTWYHVWLIQHDTTLAIDALFSLSATAPTMPSGYTAKRRIGSVYVDATPNISGFSQIGDTFILDSNVLTGGTTNWSTTQTITLRTPLGVKIFPIGNPGTTAVAAYLYHACWSPDVTDATVTAKTGMFHGMQPNSGGGWSGYNMMNNPMRTGLSSNLRAGANSSSATYGFSVFGWIDIRGKDA